MSNFETFNFVFYPRKNESIKGKYRYVKFVLCERREEHWIC